MAPAHRVLGWRSHKTRTQVEPSKEAMGERHWRYLGLAIRAGTSGAGLIILVPWEAQGSGETA